MEEIKRGGPPPVIGVIGSEYRLVVPFNCAPSPVWHALFRDAGEWTSSCHQRSMSLHGDLIIFAREKEDVPAWIEWFDRCIRSANGSSSVEWKRQRAERALADEEPRRRVRDAKEKFSHL